MLLKVPKRTGLWGIYRTDDKVVYLVREVLKEWWGRVPDWNGWRNGGNRGNGWGDSFFLKRLGYKGEERHQVVVAKEYGVEGGLIFKMGDDVEMQMERRWERG